MKKRVAIILCGLCNTNPRNFDAVFGVFERLSSMHNIDIDYYMHLWTNEHRFPENFNGKRELKSENYYEYIPSEDEFLQDQVIARLSPKEVIYSNFSETAEKIYYTNYPEYVSYVNTLGQFYAIEKMINSFDLTNYDLILRWRYDLVVNHHDFISEISNAIFNIDQSKKNLITRDSYVIGGGYNQIGISDRWFGLTPNGLNDFINIHEILFVNTGGIEKKMIYVEEAFYNFVLDRKFEPIILTFTEKILRKNMKVSIKYSIKSRQDQNKELQKFNMWQGPEHADNNYHP